MVCFLVILPREIPQNKLKLEQEYGTSLKTECRAAEVYVNRAKSDARMQQAVSQTAMGNIQAENTPATANLLYNIQLLSF